MTLEPTPKSPVLENLLEQTTGRTTAINNKTCVRKPVGCGRSIPISEFETWHQLELKEYQMSGMCKTCQDDFFKEEPDDEEEWPELDNLYDAPIPVDEGTLSQEERRQ
jgi:hypothetical protein